MQTKTETSREIEERPEHYLGPNLDSERLKPIPDSTDVLVVGVGPTGLVAATGLAKHGVDFCLVDRLAAGQNTSRAAVIHARTLEVMRELGLADRLIEAGVQVPIFSVRDRDAVLLQIRFDGLPTDFPYTLMVPQNEVEAIIEAQLATYGGHAVRGVDMAAFEEDADGVTATTADGRQIRARYVIGADGMHSRVRDAAGIAFKGGAYAQSFVLADARMDWALDGHEVMLFFSGAGLVVVAPLPQARHRIVATVDDAPQQPDRDYVQSILDARGPVRQPARIDEIIWSSRFRVHHRVAASFHAGRFVLAGDAAHVHSPAGGQGMNTGIQDAAFLAGLMPRLLAGEQGVLDRYEHRRHPVADDVVRLTDRLTRIATLKGKFARSVRNHTIAMLCHLPVVRRTMATKLAELDYR